MAGGIKEKKEYEVVGEEEEKDVECSLCMEKAKNPMIYKCCLQLTCQKCYTSWRREFRRVDCPFCRHNPTSAVKKKRKGGSGRRCEGIQKRRREKVKLQIALGKKKRSGFLIPLKAIPDIINESLQNIGSAFRVRKEAIATIRLAIEQYGVERMAISQAIAKARGCTLVRHIEID